MKTIHLYIQKDLEKGLKESAKKKGIGEGTYINELIRRDLSEEGFI